MTRFRSTSVFLFVGLGMLAMAGCQTSDNEPITDPEALRYAAEADSLGLETFLALPAATQSSRREEAQRWRTRASEASNLASEMRALRTVCGLDPTDAACWLTLARRCRWYGDYQQTEDALIAGRAALYHGIHHRHRWAAQAAITEAWLRYDRGEWKRGLAATDTARVHGADMDEVQLLKALHLAGDQHNRRAEEVAYRFQDRDHRAHWIYGVSYWRRGGPQPAHGIFTGTASSISSGAADFVKGNMSPTTVRAAECYRDFGMVEELLENWWLARNKYEFAVGHVPGRDHAGLIEVEYPPLGQTSDKTKMPIYLAFGRYYVTGSLSGYVNMALHHFEAATNDQDSEFWAAAVLDGAGSCVRLKINEAYAKRARGLVMSQVEGQKGQARVDLEAAQRWFDQNRIDDFRTLTTLAHLYLEKERPARARPLLERAVKASPENARAWSDLGLAYVRLGDLEPALAALERALELDSQLAVAWYNRGLLRYHLEDLSGAVTDLEQAHALAPDDPNISGLLEQLRRRLDQPQ